MSDANVGDMGPPDSFDHLTEKSPEIFLSVLHQMIKDAVIQTGIKGGATYSPEYVEELVQKHLVYLAAIFFETYLKEEIELETDIQ